MMSTQQEDKKKDPGSYNSSSKWRFQKYLSRNARVNWKDRGYLSENGIAQNRDNWFIIGLREALSGRMFYDNPGTVAHICNPSTLETEAGGW
jgi:hypothetical protein